jgi:hypothetical protein
MTVKVGRVGLVTRRVVFRGGGSGEVMLEVILRGVEELV